MDDVDFEIGEPIEKSKATRFFAATTISQITFGPAIASARFQLGAMARMPLIYAVVLALGVALAKLKSASLGRSVTMGVVRLGMETAGGRTIATLLFDLDGVQRGVVIIESAMPGLPLLVAFVTRATTAPFMNSHPNVMIRPPNRRL